jgi:hypothetical protein
MSLIFMSHVRFRGKGASRSLSFSIDKILYEPALLNTHPNDSSLDTDWGTAPVPAPVDCRNIASPPAEWFHPVHPSKIVYVVRR